jgi:hypothetical protein
LKYRFLLFFLLAFIDCCSQSFPAVPVPAVARIGAYGSMHPNALHGAANQAALGAVKTTSAALYGEKRFLLQELSLYHFALAQPAGGGAFGLQAVVSGNSDYSTSKVGFAYGMPLSRKVAAGLQFDYVAHRIRGFGSNAQVAVEGGMLIHFSDAFHAGVQVCHPAGIAIKGVAKLPAVYTAGMEYHPAEAVTLTAELIKTGQFPLAVQPGLEYRFAPQLWAKLGMNSRTAAFFVAAGYGLKMFRVEMVGEVHPQLGLTPGLLLLYNGMGK